MKWTHQGRLENIWIRRELGDLLYKEINELGEIEILRSNSQLLPGDTYKRCDIYVTIDDTPRATLFALKYSQVRLTQKYDKRTNSN